MARVLHKDIGDLWSEPTATFKNAAGANTDPTNLTVRVQNAAGTESVLLNNVATSGLSGVSTPVAKNATGIFQLNPGVTLDASGYWFVRFEGTGVVTATEEHQVVVDPSEFTANAGLDTRALVTLAETKDWLQSQQVQTGEDLDLVATINDISVMMHEEAQREFKGFGVQPQVRTFPVEQVGKYDPWYVDGVYMGNRNPLAKRIAIGDCADVDSVQIIDEDWVTVLETPALVDITLLPTVRQPYEPITALEFQSDVTRLSPGMRVAVTGSWGFPTVPGDVRRAVLRAVAAEYDRTVEHYSLDGVPAQAGEGQNVIVVGGGSQRLLSMRSDALAVAWRYRETQIG